MAGDETNGRNDGRKSIFTGDDLPSEDAIAPAGAPIPPRWDDEGLDDGVIDSSSMGDDGLADTPAAPPRLGLNDGDDRLPWLESADDIDPEGFDSGRIIGFVMLGLVALAMIVGAVWFSSHRGAGQADGSVIMADKSPYKVAPENPGGKKFAGTGDTSFAVAQGETRTGTIAGESGGAGEGNSSPRPGFTATAAPTPESTTTVPAAKSSATAKAGASAAASATPATSAPAAAGGVGVQVAAYTTAADAEKGWSALAARNAALAGFKHRVVEGQAEFGRVFRLQAVAGDVSAANALCAKLKAGGQGCQVKK